MAEKKQKLIDINNFHIPKGFFNDGVNVPKIYKLLNEQPTIEIEAIKHGRWITDDWESGEPQFYDAFIQVHCSECNYNLEAENGQYDWIYGEPFPLNYCPNCGAKMDRLEKNIG